MKWCTTASNDFIKEIPLMILVTANNSSHSEASLSSWQIFFINSSCVLYWTDWTYSSSTNRRSAAWLRQSLIKVGLAIGHVSPCLHINMLTYTCTKVRKWWHIFDWTLFFVLHNDVTACVIQIHLYYETDFHLSRCDQYL